MQEVCYCGRRGDVEDREPVLCKGRSEALRCPECGNLDHLLQLDADARGLVFGEAERRFVERLDGRVSSVRGRTQVA